MIKQMASAHSLALKKLICVVSSLRFETNKWSQEENYKRYIALGGAGVL